MFLTCIYIDQLLINILLNFYLSLKQTMWILDIFYIMGWLAIYFAKVVLSSAFNHFCLIPYANFHFRPCLLRNWTLEAKAFSKIYLVFRSLYKAFLIQQHAYTTLAKRGDNGYAKYL